jgi:hypothetical protein
MPHLQLLCLFGGGMIWDLLLECVPKAMQQSAAYALLMDLKPGADLAHITR